MMELLSRWFIRDRNNVTDPRVRRAYGQLCGFVGIGLNILLFAGKFFAGTLSGSVAITADAFNNLSDAGSSVVTLLGFRLAGKKPDPQHPFGHGRLEYVSGLIVAGLILLMGVELAKTSVEKILHPAAVDFSVIALVILAVSICVKLYMCLYNRRIGKKIRSAAMEATAADSLSDSVSTGVVLLSTLISHFLHVQVDGFAGLLVAVFILKTGWDSARETLDPLLGRPMDPSLAADIDRLVLSHPHILNIHDLVYHDYGPGRAMMSFHVEVPAGCDLLEIHDVVDHIERELKERHHIETVIHVDPVVNDERTLALRDQVTRLTQELDPVLTIHDFRITAGPLHTNLIFDVVVPYGFRLTDQQVLEQLTRSIRALSDHYYPVIQVDHSYIDQRSVQN